jgi:LytS/YehU family sensor histidine kinase
MNVSATIPATVQIRRSRLLGLIGAIAVLAAAITWMVLTFAVDTGSEEAQASATGAATALTPAERSVGFYLFGASDSLTPAQLESVRQYLSGAATAITSAEQSVGFYLFGASDSLTPAQLRTTRSYLTGASGSR